MLGLIGFAVGLLEIASGAHTEKLSRRALAPLGPTFLRGVEHHDEPDNFMTQALDMDVGNIAEPEMNSDQTEALNALGKTPEKDQAARLAERRARAPRNFGKCAHEGTVLATQASAPYKAAAENLAASMVKHTPFHCLFVYAHEDLGPLQAGTIEVVKLYEEPHTINPALLLPEPQFCVGGSRCHSHATSNADIRIPFVPSKPGQQSDNCTDNGSVISYGFRKAQLVKVAMMKEIIHSGYDMFVVDGDWAFTGDPIASAITPWRQAFAHSGRGPLMLAAMPDPDFFLNIGLFWAESNEFTVALFERIANRSMAAWDQYVVNEELQWNADIVCCAAGRQDWPLANVPGLSRGGGLEKRLYSMAHGDCAVHPFAVPAARPNPNFVWNPYDYHEIGRASFSRFRSRCRGACAPSR